jgi:pimeloyl-ACP methyl ester carboxylesterase
LRRWYVAVVAGLFVRRVDVGPRLVLLHGGAVPGELCWRAQLPLAERFTLEIVDRAGYGLSEPISPGEDPAADARLVPELLGEGAHVVGHSSGAAAALLAAARAQMQQRNGGSCTEASARLLLRDAVRESMEYAKSWTA